MTDTKDSDEAAQLIERLGGNSNAAKFFGVTKGAVSQWLDNGMPKDKVRILKSERPEFFARTKPVASRRKSPNSAPPE